MGLSDAVVRKECESAPAESYWELVVRRRIFLRIARIRNAAERPGRQPQRRFGRRPRGTERQWEPRCQQRHHPPDFIEERHDRDCCLPGKQSQCLLCSSPPGGLHDFRQEHSQDAAGE